MRASNLTEGLGFAEAGIMVFEDVDSNQRRAATSRQRIMRVLTSYEVILTENRGVCLTRLQCVISSSHVQEFLRYLSVVAHWR